MTTMMDMVQEQRERELMTVLEQDFGKDHWSVFGYVAAIFHGNEGIPDRQRMRCNPQRNPGLAFPQHQGWKDSYSSRLRDRNGPAGHDDWDCVADLEIAGLVRWGGTGIDPSLSLTERGVLVAAELARHKQEGGNFASFRPEQEVDSDSPIKCGTVDPSGITPEIRERMDADRAAAKKDRSR